MKNIFYLILGLLVGISFFSCSNEHNHEEHSNHDHGHDHDVNEGASIKSNHDHDHDEDHPLAFTQSQFESFGMKVDTLTMGNFQSIVKANGVLEVPPQNKASVNTFIGANVVGIEVIEGDLVKQGQALAYLSHPNLIKLQTDYIDQFNRLEYLKLEYLRQERLYNEKVSSGREFQKAKSEYMSLKGLTAGSEIQLRNMGIDLSNCRAGSIVERVPVLSPISGSISNVNVQMGQYVQPQEELFDVVNVDHIHLDLMVFEKDAHKVKKGQKVTFTVESDPRKRLNAEIYSVGKSFEEEPKAIHLHADIQEKTGLLIPGMYAKAEIQTSSSALVTIAEGGVVQEEEGSFVFTAQKENGTWIFKPLKVNVGEISKGRVEINWLDTPIENSLFVVEGAYYVMSEFKKEEAEHSH